MTKKTGAGFEAAVGDLSAASAEFCDASILVCVSEPRGPRDETRRFVSTRGNAYVVRELAGLHLDGHLAAGASLVGPSGTVPAADVYEDIEDRSAPAGWDSPFADALASAFSRFVERSGPPASALFLGSCQGCAIPGIAQVVSFSFGNPLAASGAMADWLEHLDDP